MTAASAGLQCGFGEFLGAETLAAVRAQGFTLVRIDLQDQGQERTALLAKEVLDANLVPLCIIRRAEQMSVLPKGALIELGNEPDLAMNKWSLASYIREARLSVAMAMKTGQPLDVGAVSNLNKRGFDFLRGLPWNEWPLSVGCSVHRYPEGSSPLTPHKGSRSREDEIATLRDIVGSRRQIACSETGYTLARRPDGGQWSEEAQARHLDFERQFWSKQGAAFCVVYQINSGPADHDYGLRRADGSWRPGARAFTQQPEAPPIPESRPIPMSDLHITPATITLQSDHGLFLCVELDGRVVADRQAAAAWEQFQIEPRDGGKIAIKSHLGRYLTAELDGSVTCRTTTVGEWEEWTPFIVNGRLALLNHHGKFMTAELDHSLRCRATEANVWEQWRTDLSWLQAASAPAPGGTTEAHRLVGPVRLIDGGRGGVQDDTGPRLITALHAGDLLAEAFNHGWAKVDAALAYAASRDFQAIRTWTNLPAPDWWGVPPRPGNFSDKNPEHFEFIRQFARKLVAHGLRWMVSQGDMLWLYGREEWASDYMRRLGRVLQEEGGADRLVLSVDVGNEAWNFTRETNSEKMGRILQAFLDVCPVPLRSMTSVADEGVLNDFSLAPVTVTDYHSSRMPFRHAIERIFTAGYWDGKVRPFAINSEMPGVGPFVSATSHPEEWREPEVMGAAAMACFLTRQMPTAMSSPGVIIGPEPFEAYDAQLSIYPKIAALLPKDMGSWKPFHGGDDRSFSPERILRAPEKPGTWRCDHAKAADGRVAVLVYLDEPGHLELEAINGFEGEIIHPGTLERSPMSFAAGSRVGIDLRRARLFLGRYR